MQEIYFYIKTEEEIRKINIKDYDYFAKIAVNMDPVQSVSEFEGYLIALETSLMNSDPQGIAYQRLIEIKSSYDSQEFLKLCIELNLFEKKFRQRGIKLEDVLSYNSIRDKYVNQLKINSQQFDDELSKKI